MEWLHARVQIGNRDNDDNGLNPCSGGRAVTLCGGL